METTTVEDEVVVTQVPIVRKDSITVKCPACLCVSPSVELRKEIPYRLPNPAGGSWPITYWHCQCGQILIYEPGDGGDLVLSKKVELVG